MKNINRIIGAIIIAAAFLAVGLQLVYIAREYVRNQAIDGCAAQSNYSASFEENGRQVTVSESQRHLFEKCLLNKGIILGE